MNIEDLEATIQQLEDIRNEVSDFAIKAKLTHQIFKLKQYVIFNKDDGR